MYAIITDKNGRPISDATPLPIKLVDANGEQLELVNGKLPVDANITISTVTLDDVIVKDGTGTENKMKVNEDGSLLMQQTGRNVLKTVLPTELLTKDLLKVSFFGDSIFAGWGQENSGHYNIPNMLNHILAQNSSKTAVSGDNLFTGEYNLAGVTESDGVFTLISNSEEGNPRFAMTNAGSLSFNNGELYLLTGEIDTTNSVGAQLALRYYGATSGGGRVPSTQINVGGHSASTGGYKKIYAVFSPDYLSSLNDTVVKINVGGEIVAGSTGKTGLIRNVTLHKLSKGVAIHNQGVNGNDTAEGLARISTVTKWLPDIAVIGFGTNDIRQNGITITKEEYLVNLETMCITLQEYGIYPILATIPPLANTETNYDKVADWNEGILDLADRIHVGVWDRYAAFNGDADYMYDGRHPTQEGYRLLAWSALQILLGRAQS